MITINVEPAKRRFSRRKQWQFAIAGGNNEDVDPRDTYANIGDIRGIWDRIVNGTEAVKFVVHYESGPQISYLRKVNTGRDFHDGND